MWSTWRIVVDCEDDGAVRLEKGIYSLLRQRDYGFVSVGSCGGPHSVFLSWGNQSATVQ